MEKRFLVAFALLAGLGASASAQLPQASAAALALGHNMTASARGFAAIANNPAGLGHPGSPGFSLALLAGSAEAGLGPVTLADLVDFQGRLVPASTKEEWLGRVIAAGRQTGTAGAGITPLALTIGPVGFQLSALASGSIDMPPDAAELLLFGNAGRNGTPRDFTLEHATIDGFVLSTAALSLGLEVADGLYLGVTGKYTIGNALLLGRDAGSVASASPLAVELEFPLLHPSTDDPGFDHGRGVGVDLGAIWEGAGLTLGATVQNVVHTFEWKLDRMVYRPGEALFNTDTTTSDFDERRASSAPAALLDEVAEFTIRPAFSLGAEWRPGSLLKLQADVRRRSAEGLELGPEFHAGVGAELALLSFLPLRAHVAVVTGGVQFGGGASLVLGPVNLSAAGALRRGEAEDAAMGTLALSFGSH